MRSTNAANVDRIGFEVVDDEPSMPVPVAEQSSAPSSQEINQAIRHVAAQEASATAKRAIQEAAQKLDGSISRTIKMIAAIFAVKSILLISVIGAFVIAVMAMENNTNAGLWILMAYSCLTVIPLTILDSRSRNQVNG